MNEPKRLFDCILLKQGVSVLPDMLAGKENGKWRTYSTTETTETIHKLSAGLLRLGISGQDGTIEGRDKVALISKNRPEWIMLDLAVQQIGAVLTPVYPTISVHELEFILNDAQVKLIFVNDEELFHKVLSIRDRVPSLKNIYTFEHVAHASHWKELATDASAEELARVADIRSRIRPEDLATIIYTSGTTGTPKGVMLSHHNIVSNVLSCIPCLPRGPLRALSFLPLNHIYERMLTYVYLFSGSSIYYAESMDTIGENLKEVKPQMFVTVPRLLEKVYDRIMLKGGELTGIKKKLFFWAHDLATRYEINKSMGAWYNLQLALANKLIFSKWREALGNNLTCVASGGAACQVRLIRIFTAARIPILEGYGLTETSPVISVNRLQVEDRMFGTVGPIIPDVEVRIAEDGEILCKGPNVMMGYYKRPDLTAEAIQDGWFHTGDIGVMVEDKYLKITDRKKEMFKTSGGKYVAPLAIESKLKESPYIEQLMVVGPERKFVGALIVPSFSYLKEWCRQNGIEVSSQEGMIKHPKVISFYQEIIESYNKYFSHVEQVKRFRLLPADWTVETGEMTPKLSLKRKVITEKYRDLIESIYLE
ncbi:MAG: long-chain fatty acid--CoA ligase [Chitinophagaceae bacterium]|nr:long-chain fatty acid--CoA ligase [Chitinophagaceae bacterium]